MDDFEVKTFELFSQQKHQSYHIGKKLNFNEALWLCLQEGFRGYGQTAPNPAVGCVILDKNDQLLSVGFHSRAGEAHAEIDALNRLRSQYGDLYLDLLSGAKVFVTLEPCAHQGRTGSCAVALAKLPIKKVTAILKDPNPLVRGKGFQILHDAQIETECLEDSQISGAFEKLVSVAKSLCEFFLFEQNLKNDLNQNKNQFEVRAMQPFVSMKVATSLDGMMGLKNKESKWITSNESRVFARNLRASHDAVLVGKNTILYDDPQLDFRDTKFDSFFKTNRIYKRLVILDSHGEILKNPKLKIFSTYPHEQIFIITDDKFDEKTVSSELKDVNTVKISSAKDQHQSYWQELLTKTYQLGVQSLWVEGGSEVFKGLFQSGIINRIWNFQAPILLGAKNGESWTQGLAVENMKSRINLRQIKKINLAEDTLFTALF